MKLLNKMTDQERLNYLEIFLKENGYYNLKVIEGKGICGLQNFIYTIGLCYGIDEIGYYGRYCFPKEFTLDSIIALSVWNGKEDPAGRWIKHKSYKGDFQNQSIEEDY